MDREVRYLSISYVNEIMPADYFPICNESFLLVCYLGNIINMNFQYAHVNRLPDLRDLRGRKPSCFFFFFLQKFLLDT